MKTLLRMTGLGLNALAEVAPRLAGSIGFKLFCRPLRAPLRASHRRFFSSGEQFTFQYQNNRIQCYRWGNGPQKLLFLHGWQSHSYYWKAYMEAFSGENYSLYAFDAPGHGLSSGNFLSVPLYAGLIHLFIRQQGPFQAVVSHSLGSFSLLYALHTYASVPVKKVIILASPANADEFFGFYQQALHLSQKGLHLTIRQFEHTFGQSPSEFLTSRFAASLQVPGLIIHDEQDRETPLDNARVLHASWPESHLSITSGLGHQLKSTAVVEQVREFVEEA